MRESVARMMFGDGSTAMIVAMCGVKLVGIRAAILIMTVSQFALSILVAITDGPRRAYVRRARGGHESATRYHHARRLLQFGLIPLVATGGIVAAVRLQSGALFGAALSWCFSPAG